jgi:hypothetical protein
MRQLYVRSATLPGMVIAAECHRILSCHGQRWDGFLGHSGPTCCFRFCSHMCSLYGLFEKPQLSECIVSIEVQSRQTHRGELSKTIRQSCGQKTKGWHRALRAAICFTTPWLTVPERHILFLIALSARTQISDERFGPPPLELLLFLDFFANARHIAIHVGRGSRIKENDGQM